MAHVNSCERNGITHTTMGCCMVQVGTVPSQNARSTAWSGANKISSSAANAANVRSESGCSRVSVLTHTS